MDIDQEKIRLKEGEDFTITLDSIPTGGYEWLPAFNHDVIDIISHKVQRNSEKHIGGSAKTIFKFKALNSGTTTLRIVYKRNWEDSIVTEKSYLIQVMPKC